VSDLYVHAVIAAVGMLVIIEGVLLAAFPAVFGILAGPGARQPAGQDWTRLQGAGVMLLGAAFWLAAVPPAGVRYELAVLTLALAACVMFSLAVVRRGAARIRSLSAP
jgi:hypothetical protein